MCGCVCEKEMKTEKTWHQESSRELTERGEDDIFYSSLLQSPPIQLGQWYHNLAWNHTHTHTFRA